MKGKEQNQCDKGGNLRAFWSTASTPLYTDNHKLIDNVRDFRSVRVYFRDEPVKVHLTVTAPSARR